MANRAAGWGTGANGGDGERRYLAPLSSWQRLGYLVGMLGFSAFMTVAAIQILKLTILAP